MCGIFGYIGNQDAAKIVATGLKRLEYRGYDSWGIAVVDGDIQISKKVGAIGDLDQEIDLPKAAISIGHTRWATHGGVSENNAHPHYSTDKSFALAQNGIVENYTELKSDLVKKGYKFITETDTEVIVRLIEDKLKLTKDLKGAVQKAFLELEGRNTIILISKAGQIIACRNGSPLVIGKNFATGEIYISSDTLSFAPFARDMLVVSNGQMVQIKDQNISMFDLISGQATKLVFEKVGFESEKIDKEGFEHFMLKEIYESPFVIEQLIDQPQKIYEDFAEVIKSSGSVYTIGSGTIGVAAAQIAFYLRSIGKIKAVSLIGADAVEYLSLFKKNDLIIAPSQSGETADVLEVLEKAKKLGVKIASIVNMPGSSMTRISDYQFRMQAGPEICVMSTKAFTSPISWGYLISKTVAGEYKDGIKNLKSLSIEMDKWLKNSSSHQEVKSLAKDLAKVKDIFLLGKYQNFQIIKEGMVKLIEGTYKHAHALPAGDLKHYVITLIEKGVPVVAAVSEDEVKPDLLNAIHQVKARGAKVIAIAPKPQPDYDTFIKVPDCGQTSAIMNVIPLQLLAYYMAVELGNNVDKPRNIAKSVTVK
ncbi:MAG: glutamine--fructose-6-phosphate transaminase (isomerizing) [Candidatus Daviesbacteria bacterium]|nr:glutamine--fructose-6-phosphate transaminase (isomerizing) [Candidatus Daviesbacteria bacterium]